MEITVECVPLIGVCNLCSNEGPVTSLLAWRGNLPSFANILLECLSVDITTMELGDTKLLICDSCTVQLTDCQSFKDQLVTSLKSLEDSTKACVVKIKEEPNDDFNDDDFDDDIDIVKETETLTVVIEEDPPAEPGGTDSMTISREKPQDFSETETMLAHGLFPFKIRRNRTFACAICPESSTSLQDLKEHVGQHNKNDIHTAFKNMFSNSRRFFKSSTQLRCKICSTDLTHFNELKQHVESCTRLKLTNAERGDLPFKLDKDQLDCPVCKKTFLNFVGLNTHMNVHYPNYKCDDCGKAFASRGRLCAHMRTHAVGEFPCKHCGAVFDTVTKRENHVSQKHKAGDRYSCRRCNISLNSFVAQQKHLAEIHNEELKRYQCEECPQSYSTPGHLYSHVRRDHLNERNHKCDKCDVAFYTKNQLKMHMIRHDGERIHKCHICQKSYLRKKTLKEHMRIHNNDKRFVCPVCERAFTQNSTLKGHLKVHKVKVESDEKND